MAAGTRSTSDGNSTAMAWASPDAQSWNGQPLTGNGVFSQANAATSWKSGTVVVGSVGQGANKHAAVWISASNGTPFAAAPVSDSSTSGSEAGIPSNSPPTSEMDLVTAGDLGYFAAGTLAGQPAVWYSTNGLQWSLSAQATRFFGGLDNPRINALLATSGLVYAAGSVEDGTATDAALWSTQDGLNWRSAQPPEGAFSGQGNHVITGLAQLGTGQGGTVGLVAVGGIDAGGVWAPASWISPDGMTWSQPYAAFPEGDTTGGVARAVTSVPTPAGTSELFAVGGNETSQQVWQSSDGMRWSSIPLPPQAANGSTWQATSVASNGPSMAVADSDAGQAHLLVHGPSGWSEPSSNPAVFGPVGPVEQAVGLQAVAGKLVLGVRVTNPAQAIGPAHTSTIWLTSPDGLQWSTTAGPPGPVAAPASWPPGSSAAAALGGTWIAVGGSRGSGVQSGPAVVWTSNDGSHWSSPSFLDAPPGVAAELPSAVCTSPGTAVVVGRANQTRSGTSAAAWYSTTGLHWKQAAITSSPPAGASEWMQGCTTEPGGFAAFGATVSSSGALVPALWTSPDGIRWTLQDSGAFGRGAPAPITALAASGSRWIAVAGSGDTAGTGEVATSTVGATAPSPGPTAFGLLYPLSASGTAVWVSNDAGSSWQRVDVGDPVWAAATGASVEQTAFVGTTAVVAGLLYGRLEVWTGTPSS